MAASDVRDARAALEFLLDAVERRNPFRDQMHRVAGAEEALGAAEQTWVVLMPSDAAAVAKRVGDFGFIADGRGCNLVHRGEKCRAVFVGKHQRLLGRNRKAA